MPFRRYTPPSLSCVLLCCRARLLLRTFPRRRADAPTVAVREYHRERKNHRGGDILAGRFQWCAVVVGQFADDVYESMRTFRDRSEGALSLRVLLERAFDVHRGCALGSGQRSGDIALSGFHGPVWGVGNCRKYGTVRVPAEV